MTDCGAACLRFVGAHYRRDVPVARLRQLAGTGQRGSTALGIVEAAKQLGFTAKGVKGPPEALPSVPLPAIAHCLIDQKLLHYVVLVEWTTKHARVMDPAVGRVEKWSHERFKSVWTGVLILLAPGEEFRPGDSTVSPWRRLWSLLAPHRAVLVQAFVGAVVTTILGLAMSVYVQKIVDHVIPDGNRSLLNLLGVAMLVVLAFKLVLGVFQSLLSMRTAQRIDAALILAYYRHLMRLPQAFFDTMRVGEITSRVGDAVKVRNFLNGALLNLVLNPLVLLFSLGAMFVWSWQLALLSLLLLPLNAALYWFINWRNRTYQRQIMERAADFDSQLVESLHAQPVLRRFLLEDHAQLRTEVRLVKLLKVGWRAGLAALGTGTAGAFIAQVYFIGLLWFGATLVLDTGLTPGQLMSCYTLAGYLTGPITGLLGLNTQIQETLIATDRLFEIMDLELEEDQGRVEFTANHGCGEICCEKVTFRHPGRLATLQELTIRFPPGRITALVGESGCGKSTLLALLQRLYLPNEGRILIGGMDTRYFQLASMRRHLAVLPQHTHLLSGSVIDNLAPGDPQPDMEKILHLCRATGVLEFIERLPRGFYTELSENGANLSGGQRQRLALVRALYLEAPILMLDEPSASLDPEAEKTLANLLLAERTAGRTIILSTHTSRLLEIADHIVEIREGRAAALPTAADRSREPAARPVAESAVA